MNEEQIKAKALEMIAAGERAGRDKSEVDAEIRAFVLAARAKRDEKPVAENEEELVGPLDGSNTIFEGVETPEALTEVLEQSQVTEEQEAGYKDENKQSYDCLLYTSDAADE